MKKVLLLVLMAVFSFCLLGVRNVSAATISGGTKLYFTPSGDWENDGAETAAYFFNDSTNMWANATKIDTSIYEVTAPDGSWTNVIFCRMNPGRESNGWGSEFWGAQTQNLVYDGENNHYTITSFAWGSSSTGSWSYYGTDIIPDCYAVAQLVVDYNRVFGEGVNVCFENTQVWEKVYAYYWDGSDVPYSWPGVEVPYDAESGYHIVALNNVVYKEIIFNNGLSGSEQKQTVNIDISSAVNGSVYAATSTVDSGAGNSYTYTVESKDAISLDVPSVVVGYEVENIAVRFAGIIPDEYLSGYTYKVSLYSGSTPLREHDATIVDNETSLLSGIVISGIPQDKYDVEFTVKVSIYQGDTQVYVDEVGKTYSVNSMVEYYVANAATLGISAQDVRMLKSIIA